MEKLKDYITEAVAHGKSARDRYKSFEITMKSSNFEIIENAVKNGFYLGRRRVNKDSSMVIRTDIMEEIYERNIIKLGKNRCVCAYDWTGGNGFEDGAVLMTSNSEQAYCVIYDGSWGQITMICKMNVFYRTKKNNLLVMVDKDFGNKSKHEQLEELNKWISEI